MTVDSLASARPHGRDVTLVLGGGHALGAYLAGAHEAMHAGGLRPDRVVGASTGAITAAILAGNPPERRLERLRQYWDEAAQLSPWPVPPPPQAGPLRALYNATHVGLATAFGRPSIYRPRYPDPWSLASWRAGRVAFHDHAPLRRTLERLVDFDRIGQAGPRLSLGCVDVETGEEVWFDSARDRVRPDHVLASASLMPHLPPVEIDGRLMCDLGFANSLPVDHALAEPPARDLLCLAVELFSLRGGRPASLDATLARLQDVLFASHMGHHVAALRREYALRERLEPGGPSVTLVHLAYRAPGHELAAKMFDFSPASLGERWAAGRRDMDRALGLLAPGSAGTRGRFAYLAVEADEDAGGGAREPDPDREPGPGARRA